MPYIYVGSSSSPPHATFSMIAIKHNYHSFLENQRLVDVSLSPPQLSQWLKFNIIFWGKNFCQSLMSHILSGSGRYSTVYKKDNKSFRSRDLSQHAGLWLFLIVPDCTLVTVYWTLVFVIVQCTMCTARLWEPGTPVRKCLHIGASLLITLTQFPSICESDYSYTHMCDCMILTEDFHSSL